MNVDSLLNRIKFKGRPMSRDRLRWWVVIALTRLLGREVEMEDAGGEKLRIFPIVWNGKIHLLGAEHRRVRADFSGEYTMRLVQSHGVTVTTGSTPANRPERSGGKIVHVVLGHLPPRSTERLLHHAQSLSPEYIVLLAYGGEAKNFDQIQWPHKIFLDDASLRGPSNYMSYLQLTNRFREYVKRAGINPEWVFVADYDLLPLKPDYLRGLIDLMVAQGAAAGGKNICDVSQSNLLFLCQTISSGLIDDTFNGPGRFQVYQCLGCGLLFSADCFDAMYIGEDRLATAYYEVAALTAANKKGYRLLSFDLFGDYFKHVSYRPVYSPGEALQLAAKGVTFVHPVKDTDGFVEAWKASASASGVT